MSSIQERVGSVERLLGTALEGTLGRGGVLRACEGGLFYVCGAWVAEDTIR